MRRFRLILLEGLRGLLLALLTFHAAAAALPAGAAEGGALRAPSCLGAAIPAGEEGEAGGAQAAHGACWICCFPNPADGARIPARAAAPAILPRAALSAVADAGARPAHSPLPRGPPTGALDLIQTIIDIRTGRAA